MFFEGAEKKLELVIAQDCGSLRLLPLLFWQEVLMLAKAEVLSSISNDDCDAYLLSESSLFVWNHRIVLITCGLSTLVDAANELISRLGEHNVAYLCYQRKNEFAAHLQSSSFIDDISILRQRVKGTACRIGHLDSHHHYLFTTDLHTGLEANLSAIGDTCCELLMYHISGPVADYLRADNQTLVDIKKYLQLDELFTDFITDAHLFSPFGFSINGIKGKQYFTIHITPQEQSSYVSVETNIELSTYTIDIISYLVSILQPRSWDIIGFNVQPNVPAAPQNLCLGYCSYPIDKDYNVHFSHYQQLCPEALNPELL
ncbi:adenosylmethionine decarboxylase [Shewanella aestuarii]|uniref:Adenosylmethionine decarboxylase n=1 Tax=Shewanella aestuarii TaxID=1028752 RepID=A0A6G9QKF3_9GAMM|nr:adenosylmethionine decarboxylase [Shewanella aestuarii]QIR14349.1 adenosylmethionine decarboxylase [Shewanella aestuarii]